MLTVKDLSPSTYLLRLERKDLAFNAGQCFNLGLSSSGVNREYSIYSGEKDLYLDFLIKEVPGGIVSPALRRLGKKEEINLHGPYGSFALDKNSVKNKHFTFVATGTGIAPFHSFIRSYPELNYQIVNGIRCLSERYNYESYHPSKITTCVSREKWEGFNGRVTAYFNKTKINAQSIFYLCGNQKMIQETYDLLRKSNVSGNQIFTEAFF